MEWEEEGSHFQDEDEEHKSPEFFDFDNDDEMARLRNFRMIHELMKKQEDHFKGCLDEIKDEGWMMEKIEDCVGKDNDRINNYVGKNNYF